MNPNKNYRGRRGYPRGNRSRNANIDEDDYINNGEENQNHFQGRQNQREQNNNDGQNSMKDRNRKKWRDEERDGNDSHDHQRENYPRRNRTRDYSDLQRNNQNETIPNNEKEDPVENQNQMKKISDDNDNEYKRRRFKDDNEPKKRRFNDDNDNECKKKRFNDDNEYKKRRFNDDNDNEYKRRKFNDDDNEYKKRKFNDDNDNEYKRRRFKDDDNNEYKKRKFKDDNESKKMKYNDSDDDDTDDKSTKHLEGNFQRNKTTKKNHSDEFSTHVEVKEFAQSDFFTSLITSYLNDSNHFIPINGKKFSISTINDKTILSYSPKTEEGISLMKNAITCAESLMPFTPKTILYQNSFPNCAIEVTVNGTTWYETTIHLINKTNVNLPKAFNINKDILDFLITKIDELSSSMNLYRIALTGEALSFSLDENHQDIKFSHISVSNCPTVFGKLFEDRNRLILLISPGEKMPENQKELDWMIHNLSQEEESIQTAANIAKGIVRAYHAHDLFVVKESPQFSYIGPINEFSTLAHGDHSKIAEVCDLLYSKYTRGMNLIKNIPIKNIEFVEEKESYEKIEAELKELFEIKNKMVNYKKEKQKCYEIIEADKKANRITPNSVKQKLGTLKNYLTMHKGVDNKIDILKEKKAKLLKNKNIDLNINKTLLNRIEKEGFKGRIIELFGCKVFSSEEPISDDQLPQIEKILLETERSLNINAFCVERLVSATIVVSHRATNPHSPEQFKRIINDVCDRFSFIVSFCSDYVSQEKYHKSQNGQIGVIFVEIIDPQFSVIFVSELKRALLGEQFNIFRIPKTIASKMMLNDRKNQEIVSDWIKKHKLNSIQFNGENWFGSKEDVYKAYNLISKSDTCIEFKEKVIQVPPCLSRNEINKIAKEKNWIFDHLSNCIIVNKDDANKAVQFFSQFQNHVSNDDELLGCIYVCDNKVPSSLPLTIYNQDKSYLRNFLCTECLDSTFESIIGRFFEMDLGIDFDKLMSATELIDPIFIVDESAQKHDDQCWPKLPIGQLLWNLNNDPKFSEKAKAWLTAVLSQSLHVHPEVVTFCPCHPQIILPLPKKNVALNCSIKTCSMILCQNCNEWHNEGNCPNYKWCGMRCPQCARPTVKEVGCNHISCVCGAHWCYKCGAGPFKIAHDCYEHMNKVHHGYY